jgi:hypothetical protein
MTITRGVAVLHSPFRTLPIAEFANDVAAGDRMEGERIHVMIGEDERAKA